MEWLSNFLFCHSRLIVPDGRPLYAYKCRDKDYEQLTKILSASLILNHQNQYTLEDSKLFCLYAAETFRRNHSGGSWTWETIFTPLHKQVPAHGFFEDWIELGLTWWKRPLIKAKSGKRLLLVTVACEGGLPLNLLHGEESTNLKRFFSSTLKDIYKVNNSDINAAEEIAKKNIFILPPSLRQDVVVKLGGELVYKIKELQQRVHEFREQQGLNNELTPIELLDKMHPKWRNELPLTLGDDTADTFFRGLFDISTKFSKVIKFRWCGYLREIAPSEWQVEKKLELPNNLLSTDIKSLIKISKELSPRLRLMLRDNMGVKTISLLTANRGVEDTLYRREALVKNVSFKGVDTQKKLELLLQDGGDEFVIDVLNADIWGDAPWVFKDNENKEWITEGSVKSQADSVIVVSLKKMSPQVLEGESDLIGEVVVLDRFVYRVRGTVDFIDPEIGKYRVVCKAETELSAEYFLTGRVLPEALNENSIYIGCPKLLARDKQGRIQHSLLGQIQWKSVGTDEQWSVNTAFCYGDVWVRCVDTNTDVEYVRRRVQVVPQTLSIDRKLGEGKTSGSYFFAGLEGASISSSGLQVKLHHTNMGQIEVICPHQDIQLNPISVDLQWGNRKPITISLPYPQMGASFQFSGQTLGSDIRIPIERLGGVRLLIQDQSTNSRFGLLTTLVIPNALDDQLVVRGFRYRLPALSQGYAEVGLHQWQDVISSLLATSKSIETYVRLEVVNKQSILTRINISRFDVGLTPDRENNLVYINEIDQKILGKCNDRIEVIILPLWDPTKQETLKSRESGVWEVSQTLEAGPWWIIARDSGWARFRPLLWSMSEGTESLVDATSSLIKAIKLPILEDRVRAFNTILESMSISPSHEDWGLLFVFLKMTQEFPPSSFDVITSMITCPAIMAMALLKSDAESFDRVWLLAELLPFSWVFVSVNQWLSSAQIYFQYLRASLDGLEDAEDIVWERFVVFRERATFRRQYWGTLCDWLQLKIFPKKVLLNSMLQIARRNTAFVEMQVVQFEQELQGRHDANEEIPQSPYLLALINKIGGSLQSRYSRLDARLQAIRYAPFLAAYINVNGYDIDNTLIYELKMLRAFDVEWFDCIQEVALTLELASL
jgi:hypothetical protein